MLSGKLGKTTCLALIIGLVVGALCALPPIIRPSAFVLDDSYFYLQVAHGIVTIGESTFNGITPTNGYHPLWMLFNILIMKLSGADKMVALHIAMLVQCMLLLGIVLAWWKFAELIRIRMWLIGIGLFLVYFVSFGLFGSEAYINGFMLLVTLLAAVTAIRRKNEAHVWYTSLFAGICVLARLDNIFVVAVILAHVWIICSHRPLVSRQNWRTLLAIALPFACILGTYLSWNWINYGHVMPISGVIKSTFPVPHWGLKNLGRLGYVVAIVAIISTFISFSRMMPLEKRVALRSLGIGAILHSSYVVLFTNEGTLWNWYYVGGVINLIACGCILADMGTEWCRRLDPRVSGDRLSASLAIIFSMMAACNGWATFYDPEIMLHPFQQRRCPWTIAFAERMRQTLDSGTRLLVWDMPGTFAYYSNLSIFPEDGLMGDFKSNYEMCEYGAQKYFGSKKVTMYVGPWDRQRRITNKHIQSPLYRKEIGSIELTEHNIVIAEKVTVLSLHGLWRMELQSDWVAVWKIEQ